MMRRLIARLLLGALTVAGVYVLTFLLVVALPGNPLRQGARNLPPEAEAALRVRYHMDNNWLYFTEFAAGAVRGDFGPTFMYPDWTCNQIIADALPVSMMLGLTALGLAVMIGVPAGVFSALHRDGWLDAAALGAVLVGISLPAFVAGGVLLMIFGIYLQWAPIGGWGTLAHLPLPAITLSLPFMAYITRLTRTAMLDVLTSDHIRTARAMGIPRRRIIWKYALKPACLPVLSYLGPAAAQAMTGSFVVEKVFGVPGLGQHFVNAALNHDAGLIMSTVLVFSTMLVAFNLLVDLLYAWVDPRVEGAV
jgi:oligopeptide transport system permease protein